VGSFAVASDEAEELDGSGAGGAEPVWGSGVELGDFAGFEDEVLVAEHESEPAGQDVDPVVAFMGAQVGLGAVGSQDELVGLDTAGVAGEWDDRGAVTVLDRPQVDTRIAGGGCIAISLGIGGLTGAAI